MSSIHEIVRKAEQDYTSQTVKLGKYVDWSMYETIETIVAYLNSKHISGSKDSLGRDKPFFNIVTAAVNIWYRATDIDRKDIIVLPNSRETVVAAFLATILLQDWMKRSNFSIFLNQWGRTLAQYGSAVTKFVEKDGTLIPSVVSWDKIICDPIDFYALPVIEKFYRTEAQLINMATKGHPDYSGYDLDKVKSFVERYEQTRELLDGQQKDNNSEFIELYEVHGNLSMEEYKKGKGQESSDSDENIYFQQMHVISYCKTEDDKYEDFTLYCGREEKNPYVLTHLIEEQGRTLAIGAVEYLFDAQWMANHTIKQWKDQMDLASKMVFQTADKNFAGKNILTDIETGDIKIHSVNMPVTQFPNVSHDIGTMQSFLNQWITVSREITSTPDAVRGNTMPSSTPYSLGAYLGAQSLSLFEIMTENKGNDLEVMLRKFVIPNLIKKLSNTDDVVAILEDRDLTKIDSMFVPREAIRRHNKVAKEMALNGQPPLEFDKQGIENAVKTDMSALGNMRVLSTDEIKWSEVFKDLEWKLDIGITNEQFDKSAVITTLSTVLQGIASNPAILQNKDARMVFNKILSVTGQVSPVELSTSVSEPQAAPPVGAGMTPDLQGLANIQNG